MMMSDSNLVLCFPQSSTKPRKLFFPIVFNENIPQSSEELVPKLYIFPGIVPFSSCHHSEYGTNISE